MPRGCAVLVILVVGHLVNVATGPVAYVMNLTGGHRTTARVYLAGAVVTVGLNLILIPAFGLIGGALATTAGMIVWNVVLAVLVVRRRGPRTSILHALLARRAA